jgi:hypothetical protein
MDRGQVNLVIDGWVFVRDIWLIHTEHMRAYPSVVLVRDLLIKTWAIDAIKVEGKVGVSLGLEGRERFALCLLKLFFTRKGKKNIPTQEIDLRPREPWTLCTP